MGRVLAFHQYGWGSIFIPGAICRLSLLVHTLLQGFFSGIPVFLPREKTTIPNKNQLWFLFLDPKDLDSVGKTVLVEDMHTRKRSMLEQVVIRDRSKLFILVYSLYAV